MKTKFEGSVVGDFNFRSEVVECLMLLIFELVVIHYDVMAVDWQLELSSGLTSEEIVMILLLSDIGNSPRSTPSYPRTITFVAEFTTLH